MTPANDDLRVLRISSEDVPERDRLEYVREVYGRVIIKHDIEPSAHGPLLVRGTLRALPDLGLASMECSAVRVRRKAAQIDSDDLVLNISLAGGRVLRVSGREAAIGEGEAVLGTCADAGTCDVYPGSRFLSVRLPFKSLAPICADLDRVLFRPISARTPALALLASYAAVLQDTQALATPELRRLVVAHMHDLVALAVGATRDAAETARGRGVRAARLRAIKADIAAHVGDEGLSVTETAKRHRVTPRYLHMLFEAEGKTFSDYVIEQRLARAYRILTDARFADRAISAIAFEVGFGNLSYFNRVFRRRYGATPSEVREAAWRQSRN